MSLATFSSGCVICFITSLSENLAITSSLIFLSIFISLDINGSLLFIAIYVIACTNSCTYASNALILVFLGPTPMYRTAELVSNANAPPVLSASLLTFITKSLTLFFKLLLTLFSLSISAFL